jgi:hypothetical protein
VAAGTATLTVSSTASTSGALAYPLRPGRWHAAAGAALACLLLFGIPARRRSWRAFFGLFVLSVALASGLVACGSKSSTSTGNPGTTTGAYTVTVTATSGATTQTGTVQVTVQ